MKKFLFLFLSLILTSSAFAAEQWVPARPAAGDSLTAYPADSLANNDAVQRLLAKSRTGELLTYNSSSTLTIGAGSIMCSNLGGSIFKMRQNPNSINITASNLDTGGSFSSSSTYYVYATCDSDVTGNSFFISLNSSAPTGSTYYAKLGSFYVNSATAITRISNYDGIQYYDISPSDITGGTFSANTVYQNLSPHKLMVVWWGSSCGSSSLAANQVAYIGESSSPSTEVTAVNYVFVSQSASAGVNLGASFVVPAGWYWEVTNDATSIGCTASLQRLEAFEIN